MSVFSVFIVGLAVTAGLACWVATRAVDVGPGASDLTLQPGLERGDTSLRGRWRHVLQAAFESFGQLGPFLLTALAGTSAAIAVCWPLGKLSGAVEGSVDVPVFHWAQDRPYGGWRSMQQVLTQMGNSPQIQVVVVVVSVALAVVWRKRGWWIPPLALVATYGTEKYVQTALGRVADRGHPPTTMGTFPSGGCARLVTVWGVSLLLVTLTWSFSRRVRVVLWTLLAVAAFLEGYARTYLLQHWFTDVVGGWVYGALLLITYATATAALVRYHGHRDDSPTGSATELARS